MTTITKSQKIQHEQDRETLQNDALKEFDDSNFAMPTTSHQGDLVFIRIVAMPKSAKPRQSRQLAEGDTQGSRHILTEGAAYDCDPKEVAALIFEATCRKCDIAPQYIGPVFTGERCYVSHPEHGDHLYLGGMVIATVYQRNLDVLEQEQRVLD